MGLMHDDLRSILDTQSRVVYVCACVCVGGVHVRVCVLSPNRNKISQRREYKTKQQQNIGKEILP